MESSISQPCTSEHFTGNGAVIDRYHQAITGHVVGPMPVRNFIDEFLPLNPAQEAPWTDTSSKAFINIENASSEIDMYPLWVEATAPFSPNLELVETHPMQTEPLDDQGVRPSVIVYSGSSSRREGNVAPAGIILEFRHRDDEDPFTDEDAQGVERETDAAGDSLGQMALSATAHLAAQFRTHIFSLLIFRSHSRLLRWDRSGVIVTHRFPMAERHTAEFLWRYSHASQADRGYDAYARWWTPDKRELSIRAALRAPAGDLLVQLTLSDHSHTYVVHSPSCPRAASPTGRSTRSFLAYCVQTDEVVWLKDTWRIISPSFTAEHLIYEKLHAHGVPHIPRCREGSDIGDCETGPGAHRTKTQDYQTESWARPLPKPLRTLRHYRLILQDVGRDCTQFDNVKQFVKVIRDVSEAHDCAYFDARILHRDISVGNILIVGAGEDAHGMLIDWDLAKDLDAADDKFPNPAEHIGTWPFMAARLQLRPRNGAPPIVSREDDLESFLYVMIWVALRYMDHDLSMEQLASVIDLFKQRSPGVSGRVKKGFLGSGNITEEVAFKNQGMVDILGDLSKLFGVRYGILSPRTPFSMDPGRLPLWQACLDELTEAFRMTLETRGGFVGYLDAALAAGVWEPHHENVVHKLSPRVETL